MDEFWIDMGLAVLFRVLKSGTKLNRYAQALAKLYVAIGSAAERNPVLASAIKEREAE